MPQVALLQAMGGTHFKLLGTNMYVHEKIRELVAIWNEVICYRAQALGFASQ